MEIKELWKISTFEKYHNNADKFVEEVIKFFFNKLDDSYVDEDSYMYCFYRINGKFNDFYEIKTDAEFERDGPLENFKQFIDYYGTKAELSHLHKSLQFRTLPEGDIVAPIVKEETPIYNTNNVFNYINNVFNHNITVVNNNNNNTIFGLAIGNCIEKIISESYDKRKTWKNNDINILINDLKTVVSYDELNNKYNILGADGCFETDEGWLSHFIYWHEKDNTVFKLKILDLIKSNKASFTDPKTIIEEPKRKKIKIPTLVENLNKNLDQEIEWIDEFVTLNKYKCMYRLSGIHFEVSHDKIISVNKLYEEVMSNITLIERMTKILGYFETSNTFVKAFKRYISDHSKKYYVKLKENGKHVTGTRGESLVFIKHA